MRKEGFLRPNEGAMLRVLENNKGTMAEIILSLAWNMGLSREEMCRLMWSEVSFTDGQIDLPDRSVPLDEDTRRCLEARREVCGEISEFIVISDRRRGPMRPESISRIAREALDAGGLLEVRLMDLRHDWIIRQLERYDWPYAARISGIAVPTLHAKFSKYLPERAGVETAAPVPKVDEFRMWKVLQAEGASPVGLALWMGWKLGLQGKEMVSLTWDQVDFETGVLRLPDREIPMGVTLEKRLRQVLETRRPGADPHVLLTPQSRRPYDQARLSKLVRTVLIRGGMENLTLRDLVLEEKREGKDALLLRHAEEKGSITRGEVMSLLQVTKVPAYERLRRLTEQGRLVRVGAKYYPAGTVVPPEKQYETLRGHLKTVGSAYRQELASLLRVGDRQCQVILRRFVREDKLVRTGQRYALPEEKKRNA